MQDPPATPPPRRDLPSSLPSPATRLVWEGVHSAGVVVGGGVLIPLLRGPKPPSHTPLSFSYNPASPLPRLSAPLPPAGGGESQRGSRLFSVDVKVPADKQDFFLDAVEQSVVQKTSISLNSNNYYRSKQRNVD